ncbi:MAG: RNA polymerase sigma factor [Bacteroidales bacterium]|nr:RNA polymerase sigma factor [Bacteroidales bacterium]
MTVEEYNISVEEYSDRIYRFVLKNTRDQDKSRDIVQDTFEKLWIKKDNVSFDKVKSYLFTTAYHSFIDLTRKDKRQTDIEEISMENYSHSEQYSDLKEILNKAIEQMPEIQRSVVLLRDYEGYSYSEIAEVTGLNEAQVKVYIYRGRMFLKNYIGKLETVV